MAAILTVLDGHKVKFASVLMAEVYDCVGQRVLEKKFSRWLRDLAGRPAPFLDISLMGLSADRRTAFYRGLESACEQEQRSKVKEVMSEICELIRFVEKRHPGFFERPATGRLEDLDEIWEEPNQPPEPMSGLAPGHGSS